MNPQKDPQQRGQLAGLLFALPFLGFGLFFILASTDLLGFTLTPSPGVPLWMVTAAGVLFLLGGLMMALQVIFPDQASQQTQAYRWIHFLMVGLLLLVFSGIFLWIGFGPGERHFQSGFSFGNFYQPGNGDEMVGRLIFGGAGLLTGLLGLWNGMNGLLDLLGLKPPSARE